MGIKCLSWKSTCAFHHSQLAHISFNNCQIVTSSFIAFFSSSKFLVLFGHSWNLSDNENIYFEIVLLLMKTNPAKQWLGNVFAFFNSFVWRDFNCNITFEFERHKRVLPWISRFQQHIKAQCKCCIQKEVLGKPSIRKGHKAMDIIRTTSFHSFWGSLSNITVGVGD